MVPFEALWTQFDSCTLTHHPSVKEVHFSQVSSNEASSLGEDLSIQYMALMMIRPLCGLYIQAFQEWTRGLCSSRGSVSTV